VTPFYRNFLNLGFTENRGWQKNKVRMPNLKIQDGISLLEKKRKMAVTSNETEQPS
jgi:hypothetical protein